MFPSQYECQCIGTFDALGGHWHGLACFSVDPAHDGERSEIWLEALSLRSTVNLINNGTKIGVRFLCAERTQHLASAVRDEHLQMAESRRRGTGFSDRVGSVPVRCPRGAVFYSCIAKKNSTRLRNGASPVARSMSMA